MQVNGYRNRLTPYSNCIFESLNHNRRKNHQQHNQKMKAWVLSNLCRKDVLTFLKKTFKKGWGMWGSTYAFTGTTQYVSKNRRLLFKVRIRSWHSFSLRKHKPSLTKQRKRPWLKGLERKECSLGSNALSKHFTQNADLAKSPYLRLLMFPFTKIKSNINKKSKWGILTI